MDRKNVTRQLLAEKKLVEYGAAYFANLPESPGVNRLSKIRNMTSSGNAVIVMGAAKSGSHLMMSILDALGKAVRNQAVKIQTFQNFEVSWRTPFSRS